MPPSTRFPSHHERLMPFWCLVLADMLHGLLPPLRNHNKHARCARLSSSRRLVTSSAPGALTCTFIQRQCECSPQPTNHWSCASLAEKNTQSAYRIHSSRYSRAGNCIEMYAMHQWTTWHYARNIAARLNFAILRKGSASDFQKMSGVYVYIRAVYLLPQLSKQLKYVGAACHSDKNDMQLSIYVYIQL